MIKTKRKPNSVGEILLKEFMSPKNTSVSDLAKLMGVEQSVVEGICNDKIDLTEETAYMLSQAFKTSTKFWLNIQNRTKLWNKI